MYGALNPIVGVFVCTLWCIKLCVLPCPHWKVSALLVLFLEFVTPTSFHDEAH